MARQYPHPRNWSEMSTDFQLMMILHGCMIVVWMLGSALSIGQELAIAGVLLAGALVISVWHKRAAGWRWRGADWKDALNALLSLVLIVLFLGASIPLASPIGPQMLPWFIAGANLGLFNILGALHLVNQSKEEFLAQCVETADEEITESTPPEPAWRRILGGAYSVAFLVVWLAGVASFYFFGVGMRDGAPTPTATEIEPLTDHGHTVFVTAHAKQLIDLLQTAMFVGIPAIMAAGAILHFVLKIPVFGNRRTD